MNKSLVDCLASFLAAEEVSDLGRSCPSDPSRGSYAAGRPGSPVIASNP